MYSAALIVVHLQLFELSFSRLQARLKTKRIEQALIDLFQEFKATICPWGKC